MIQEVNIMPFLRLTGISAQYMKKHSAPLPSVRLDVKVILMNSERTREKHPAPLPSVRLDVKDILMNSKRTGEKTSSATAISTSGC